MVQCNADSICLRCWLNGWTRWRRVNSHRIVSKQIQQQHAQSIVIPRAARRAHSESNRMCAIVSHTAFRTMERLCCIVWIHLESYGKDTARQHCMDGHSCYTLHCIPWRSVPIRWGIFAICAIISTNSLLSGRDGKKFSNLFFELRICPKNYNGPKF